MKAITVLLTVLALGCQPKGSETDNTVEKVECGALECDIDTTFCVESTQNDVPLSNWCAPRPDNCAASSCDCDYETAAVEYVEGEGVANCTGAVLLSECDSNGEYAEVIITCEK